MPEALTESFCERCGTRYDFKAPARLNTLRKTRGLVSGLKNYIMSQDTLTDAVGDAMRSEEEELASFQLEAFHAAFNFCIDCRQYACTNCWNDAAGRCRSCAPIRGKDDLTDRLQAAYLADHQAMHADAVAAPELAMDDISRQLGVEAWPESDLLEVGATNGHAAVAWPDETVETEREPMAAEVVAPEPEAEPEPMAAEVAAAAANPEPEEFSPILGWEDDAELIVRAPIEQALPEPETVWVAAELEPEPEWVAEPEAVVAEVAPEPEPEPVVAEVAPEPEPEPVEPQAPPAPLPPTQPIRIVPRIRPISETIIRPPSAAPPAPIRPEPARVDEGALAARRAQLDILGLDDPGQGTVEPERRVLPYRSGGASVHASEIRQRMTAGTDALWDASAREVAAARSAVAVQNCGGCGLSLSASARFCRRCGTRQAQSA
jgi:hypothetical protein